MKRISACLLVEIPLAALAAAACAEQAVNMKDGTTLYGDVAIDGKDVVVQIDKAKLRVPLANVASVAPADFGRAEEARRLLLTALESRLLTDNDADAAGVLAEAARLAPDDPHVAYWYVTSLVDAGSAKAASDVYQRHREEIAKVYPQLVDRLENKINKRLVLEQASPGLLERMDQIAAESKSRSDDESRTKYVAFHLVDQTEKPIERSAFRIEFNGQNERLEPFDAGYYLWSYQPYQGNPEQPTRLKIAQPGLRTADFDLRPSASAIESVSQFAVERFADAAKETLHFLMTVNDNPFAHAKVTLRPVTARGEPSEESSSAESDADGRAEFLAFPADYSYVVEADGFKPEVGHLQLPAGGADAKWEQVSLYRAISAKVRIAWLAVPLQGGDSTTGDAVVEVGLPAREQNDGGAMSWLRPVQIKNSLGLQLIDQNYGPNFGGASRWIRVMQPEAGVDGKPIDEWAADSFQSLDLKKIDELKEKSQMPKTVDQPPGARGTMTAALEQGKVYFGKTTFHDMRTGQPTLFSFKAIVESRTGNAKAGD